MSLYKKTILIISISLIVLITIIYIFSYGILKRSFKELEDKYVQSNVERMISVINDEILNLNRTLHDWAVWDDSYYFIQGKYKNYIDVNLTDSTFINLNLNVIMFLDKSWDLYYSKAFDLINQKPAEIPKSLYDHIKSLKGLKAFDIHHKSIYGILRFDDRAVLIALHPIVDSKERKEPEGILVFCRFLNDEWAKNLSKKIMMNVSMKMLDNRDNIGDRMNLKGLNATNLFIRTIDSDYIEGSTNIKDIYGKDVISLSVTMKRDIYKHFDVTIKYMIATFLIIGSSTVFFILLIIKKLVLTRLQKITDGIIEIRRSGNSSLRLDIKGKDEISMLAEEINKMLQAQKETEKILHTYSLTDDLTGLYNRRGFITLAEQQFKIADRSHGKMLLIYIDVDNLKDINDSFGHLEGDRALIDIAGVIKDTFRESDIVARIGGDEFVILTTEADNLNFEKIISRLLENIKRFNQNQPRKYILSVSIGYARYDPDNPNSIDDLIAEADRRMYENKKGR